MEFYTVAWQLKFHLTFFFLSFLSSFPSPAHLSAYITLTISLAERSAGS